MPDSVGRVCSFANARRLGVDLGIGAGSSSLPEPEKMLYKWIMAPQPEVT